MKLGMILLTATFALSEPTAAWSQTVLSETDVRAAIADGERTKRPQSYVFTAGGDEATTFWVAVRGPYGRVAAAAAESASKYQPFTIEQVKPEMTETVLEVRATPGKPELLNGRWVLTAPATHMVLRPRGQTAVIQPKTITTFPYEWANAVGGKFQGQGVAATFDLGSLPPGDLDIVVVTEGYERVRTLKAKDRSRVR